MIEKTTYEKALDPRTGLPMLPLDAENARRDADAASEPLTDEDNLGVEIDDDAPGVSEGEDPAEDRVDRTILPFKPRV